MASVRQPAVAGTFYKDGAAALRQQVESCFTHALGPGRIPQVAGKRAGRLLGLISPHAGLVYSGPAAAWGYASLAEDGRPPLAVLIGPSHTGLGAPLAISAASAWATPLGEVPVAAEAARALIAADDAFAFDDLACRMEHSLEVQMPFLQFLFGDAVPILPIVIRAGSASAVRSAQALSLSDRAASLAALLRDTDGVIVASTDLSHFEGQAVANAKDRVVLDAITALDPDAMLRAVDAQDISMCGVLPVAVALMAARRLDASAPNLLHYHTSGDIAGGQDQVVGYASLTFARGGTA